MSMRVSFTLPECFDDLRQHYQSVFPRWRFIGSRAEIWTFCRRFLLSRWKESAERPGGGKNTRRLLQENDGAADYG